MVLDHLLIPLDVTKKKANTRKPAQPVPPMMRVPTPTAPTTQLLLKDPFQ
jgi:hypothetical protein